MALAQHRREAHPREAAFGTSLPPRCPRWRPSAKPTARWGSGDLREGRLLDAVQVNATSQVMPRGLNRTRRPDPFAKPAGLQKCPARCRCLRSHEHVPAAHPCTNPARHRQRSALKDAPSGISLRNMHPPNRPALAPNGGLLSQRWMDRAPTCTRLTPVPVSAKAWTSPRDGATTTRKG